jgi:hypothetical protein
VFYCSILQQKLNIHPKKWYDYYPRMTDMIMYLRLELCSSNNNDKKSKKNNKEDTTANRKGSNRYRTQNQSWTNRQRDNARTWYQGKDVLLPVYGFWALYLPAIYNAIDLFFLSLLCTIRVTCTSGGFCSMAVWSTNCLSDS